MQEFILFRGTSFDGKEAKRILKETNINFAEVFSDSDERSPVLITKDSIYSYKGLAEIKEYVNSLKYYVLSVG
jgi:hypothetical protein